VAADLDLLVLGDANPDLVLTGDVVPAFSQAEQVLDDAVLTIGGSGAIAACAAARLGLHVAICGVIGDDRFGAFMRDALTDRGVDVRGLVMDPAQRTGLTVVLVTTDDRSSLTLPAAIAALTADAIDPDLLAAARHVHVSQYFMQDALRADLPALFDDVRAHGGTTSVDPNADPTGAWDGGLRDRLPRVDVFLPNAAEVVAIGGAADPVEAARALGAPLTVVKDGANGAVAIPAGGQPLHAGARRVDFVDATGAGDTFDAGFLAARLEGRDLADALAFANACAALSTRAFGGVDAQPTRAEVDALLAGTW
jgi:sugar/nucleoside kinase (ribokinase family)